MTRTHFFGCCFGFSAGLTSTFIASVNFRHPLGFFAFLITAALLLDSHETAIANGGEFAVGQSLAQHALQQCPESIGVCLPPHTVPECLFARVPVQVERRDVRIRPLDGSLEDRPEVLQPVRMDRSESVGDGVIDCPVQERIRQAVIRAGGVGVDRRASIDVAKHVAAQRGAIDLGTNESPYFSAALQDALHGRHVIRAAPGDELLSPRLVHVGGLAPDIGFVRLNLAVHLVAALLLHPFSDAMQHEPRRILADANRAPEFVAADPVAAVDQIPDGHEPLGQRDFRLLENRPDRQGDLFLAFAAIALEQWPILHGCDALTTAARAGDLSVRPFESHHQLAAEVFVREVADGFDQCLGQVVHGSGFRVL